VRYLKLELRVIQRGQFRGQLWDYKEQLDNILTQPRPGDPGFRTIDEAMQSIEIGKKLRAANGLFEMSDEEYRFIRGHMESWRPPIADDAVIAFHQAILQAPSERPEEFPAEV
jgi:hypothetical protein